MTTELLSPVPHDTLAGLLDQVGPPGPLSPRHRWGAAHEPTPTAAPQPIPVRVAEVPPPSLL